jgi:hypothetical protein
MISQTLRRCVYALLILLLTTCAAEAYIRSELDYVKPGINIEPDQILILVTPSIAPLKVTYYDSTPLTGVRAIDELCDMFGVTRIKKTFYMPAPDKNPKIPDISRYYTIYFPEEVGVEMVGMAFEDCPLIEEAEFVHITQQYFIPDDPRYRTQWHLDKCGFPGAWDVSHGSKDISVGIVDGGMDMPFDEFGEPQIHEDIAANLWVNPGEDIDNSGTITLDDWDGRDNDGNGFADDFHGWDITGNSNWPHDPHSEEGGGSHGTHVAGIASAVTDNGVGISSAGFGCSLIIAACYHPRYDSLVQNGYAGIEYCGIAGADIINCSWGGNYRGSNAEQRVVDGARARGSIIFAATGNGDRNGVGIDDGPEDQTHHYPAAYNGVIGIAASDNNDRKTGFSNYGTIADLVAPGEAILSTVAHNRYTSYPGTSMASPLAAGLGALILSSMPHLDEDGLLNWMQDHSTNISALNDNMRGIRYRINADFALNATHPRYILSEWNLRELNGNDDGRPDPNESSVIEFVLENTEGYSTAMNTMVTLSSDDPMIRVEREVVSVGNIIGGQQVFNGGDNGLRFLVRHASQPHYSKLTLTVTDTSDYVQRIYLDMTIGHPYYLLVDDDEGVAFESFYHNDLMRRPVVHDVWHVDSSGAPNAQKLREYKYVIWETGNSRNALTQADQDNLSAFLNSGGKSLILSGQYLGEDIGGTQFHQNYLHARHGIDNVNIPQLTGMADNPISAGTSLLLIGGSGAGNGRLSPSSMVPINGADTLYTYNGSTHVGGIFFANETYAVIYLGFALEAAASTGAGGTTIRADFIERAIDRLFQLDAPGDHSVTLPAAFRLSNPYPNPFNAQTSVRVNAPAGKEFSLRVIDLSGRVVATLHRGVVDGETSFIWIGDAAPAGIYVFRMEWDGGVMTQKAALVK